MKYATAKAFRTALEARLLAQANGGQASLVHLRKLVVFDRLLARLLVVAPDKWIIKGGVALDFRFGEKARATVDLDLSRYDHEEQVAEDMSAAQSVPLDDYFSFRIRKASTLRFGEGAAIRYRAMALLDNRKFEEVPVDVGFSDFF